MKRARADSSGADKPTNAKTKTGSSSSSAAAAVSEAGGDDEQSRTVYVEGIPFDSTEDAVRDLFSRAGTVSSMRLSKWHDTGRLKGYGHIVYESAKEAKAAIDLNGEYLGKRYVKVEMAQAGHRKEATSTSAPKEKPIGCRTIFVKNLPYDTTEDEVREAFKQFGPINNVRLAYWAHTSNLKGFGYVEFKREDSTVAAVKHGSATKLRDRGLVVDYEDKPPKGGYKKRRVD